jgi:hypothetical protein
VLELVGLLGSKRANEEIIAALLIAAAFAGVELSSAGVRKGWALWPVNFDPTWVESCDNFKEKRDGRD